MTVGLTKHPLRLGIVGAIVTAILLYLAFTKDVPFVEGYRVEAVFSNTTQIRDGSPVRIAGVDVGKVIATELGEGETTVLTLELEDSGRPLHADAEMKIRPRLFLEGSYVVDVEPGSPSAPEVPDGGRIPLPQTAVPVPFNEVLSTLPSDVRGKFASAIDELATALGEGGAEALARAQEPLAPLLRDSSVVAKSSRGSEAGDLARLTRGAARTTAALASRDAALAQLVTDLNTVTGVLAERSEAVSAGMRQLDGTLRETPAALTALDGALPPTRRLVAAARPSLRLLPEILDDSNFLLTQLNALAAPEELNALLDDLEPTLRDLPPLGDRLLELLPLLTPVADCLRERAIPVLTAKLDDGALSTGQPVYLELVHGAVGLAGASQSFDANGHWARYLAAAGDNTLSLSTVGGPLFGRGASGAVGARPVPLPIGQTPPLRPDQECRDQAAPDLSARTNTTLTRTRRTAPARTTLRLDDLPRLVRRASAEAKRERRGR